MTHTEQLLHIAGRFFAQSGAPKGGGIVFCALSGGPDSVALLHVLRHFAPQQGFALRALHLNHGLRGDEALRDEQFVTRLCATLEVPLIVGHANMRQRPLPQGESEETAARRLRYDFFEREAVAAQAAGVEAFVATAHTASDNAETLLFRLARGTSLAGAGGIPPRRGRYLRPLLGATRAQILAYCAENQFEFVTDSTNNEPFCSRNLLRLQALPVLQQINPAATENLAAFAADAREDAEFLQQLAEELLQKSTCGAGWKAVQLAAAPPPVLRAALAFLLKQQQMSGREKVTRCLQVLQGEVVAAQLSGSVTARRSGGVFYFEQAARVPVKAKEWQLPLQPGCFAVPTGGSVTVLIKDYEKTVNICGGTKKQLKNAAEYGMINEIPVFRTRRARDTFRPAGRGVTKTLKKLLAEDGVPVAQRDRLLLLAVGGKVLWLEGYGFCEGLAAQPGCERVLQIDRKPEE
ncbi:MAG: tRNA(Ile)-lysidine synthase [Clostridiales bacterium]|nr:tRNA(Ile)-lysidine synthase [Clostridiales bacterium]